jgi:hypothetical protein
VRAFLLAAETEHPAVIRSLGFARFRPAPADPTDEIKRLAQAHRRDEPQNRHEMDRTPQQ